MTIRKKTLFFFSKKDSFTIGVLLTLLYVCGMAQTAYAKLFPRKPTFAFVVPMPSEAAYVCQHYFNHCQNPKKINGINYYAGSIHGRPALLVISGVGVVNTSITTIELINHFHPKYLAMFGSSGGINSHLRVGDVVIGGRVYDYEFGSFNSIVGRPTYPLSQQKELINPNNHKKMPLVFGLEKKSRVFLKSAYSVVNNQKKYPLLPKVVTKENESYLPQIKIGTIADSSVFPTPESMVQIMLTARVDVVAFEDAAFLQTCWFTDSHCFSVRSISNVLPYNQSNSSQSASQAGMYAGKVAIRLLEKEL